MDVQYTQIEKWTVCVKIYNLFWILDLFPNRTSDTCKIQSSRFDRILWSQRWWKVVSPQKFVNIVIRNSENVQVFEDLQTLLASSGGLLGVSWPRDPWFDSWCDEFSETSIASISFYEEILEIRKNANFQFFVVFRISKNSNWNFHQFKLFKLFAKIRKFE